MNGFGNEIDFYQEAKMRARGNHAACSMGELQKPVTLISTFNVKPLITARSGRHDVDNDDSTNERFAKTKTHSEPY
jgi:hypothetical protein